MLLDLASLLAARLLPLGAAGTFRKLLKRGDLRVQVRNVLLDDVGELLSNNKKGRGGPQRLEMSACPRGSRKGSRARGREIRERTDGDFDWPVIKESLALRHW